MENNLENQMKNMSNNQSSNQASQANSQIENKPRTITKIKHINDLTHEGLTAYGEGKELRESIISGYARKVLYLGAGIFSAMAFTFVSTSFIIDKEDTFNIPYMIGSAAFMVYSGIEYVNQSKKIEKENAKLNELVRDEEYRKVERILNQYNI